MTEHESETTYVVIYDDNSEWSMDTQERAVTEALANNEFNPRKARVVKRTTTTTDEEVSVVHPLLQELADLLNRMDHKGLNPASSRLAQHQIWTNRGVVDYGEAGWVVKL